MGNRAVIKGKGSDLGVYVHWNGGYESVLVFTQYCKLKGYRSPETDDYGVARLVQVIANFFGGSTSIGVWNMKDETVMTPHRVGEYWLDNGVYEIENWEIVAHWNSDLVQDDPVNEEDLLEFLCEIDENMPKKEQLGKAFICAKQVKTSEVKVGDKVWLQTGYHDMPFIYTVMGITEAGIPYVNCYDHNGDWSWNPNNHIKSELVRIAE